MFFTAQNVIYMHTLRFFPIFQKKVCSTSSDQPAELPRFRFFQARTYILRGMYLPCGARQHFEQKPWSQVTGVYSSLPGVALVVTPEYYFYIVSTRNVPVRDTLSQNRHTGKLQKKTCVTIQHRLIRLLL